MSDPSDHEDHSSPSDLEDGDESISVDSGSEDANDLLDMEAVESNGLSDDQSDHGRDSDEEEFHYFLRLPIELRTIIWEHFDPYLKSPNRILEVNSARSHYTGFDVQESAFLDQQTAPARAMLSTHQESRRLALQYYPHVIEMYGGRSILRFNKHQDLIYLSSGVSIQLDPWDMYQRLTEYLITHQLKDVSHLALDLDFSASNGSALFDDNPRPRAGCNLTVLYLVMDDSQYRAKRLRWLGSDTTKTSLVYGTEETPFGSCEDVPYLYCWPGLDDNTANLGQWGTLPLKPVIKFNFQNGLERYEAIKAVLSLPEADFSNCLYLDDDISSEAWSYHSSNNSADQSISEDDSLDGFVVGDGSEGHGGDSEDDPNEEAEDSALEPSIDGDRPSYNGFSPLEGEANGDDEPNGLATSRFSSLEADSTGIERLEESASEDEIPAQRRRKRRVVSDDEDDDAEASQKDPSEKQARSSKRARLMVADTDDEDEDDSSESDQVEPNSTGQRSETDSEDEDDDEESEADDEESAPAKPMSLFQKLSQFRSDNPITSSGSDAGASDSQNGDHALRGHLSDEDDEEDDFDEASEGMAGGVIADMAEEEDDGEEAEDDW